ncbi:MAG: hypothetical protein ABJA57_05980 [Ginsengibacter sp.]
MAHLFWYSEHIATVHCVNGKYHVHYEVMDAARKTSSEKSNLPKMKSANEHLAAIADDPLFASYLISQFYNSYSSPPVTSYTKSDFPPPRV